MHDHDDYCDDHMCEDCEECWDEGYEAGRSAARRSGGRGKTSSSGGCYIATSVYGSYDCPQVWTLRRFRDDRLAVTAGGRAFIRAYYAVSPVLVRRFGECGWFRRLWRGPLDALIRRLQAQGVSDAPYRDLPRK